MTALVPHLFYLCLPETLVPGFWNDLALPSPPLLRLSLSLIGWEPFLHSRSDGILLLGTHPGPGLCRTNWLC